MPLRPGEVLREEFLEPLGLSAGRVAKRRQSPGSYGLHQLRPGGRDAPCFQ